MMYYPYENQYHDPNKQRVMTVIGNGQLSVRPDTVHIQLEVVTNSDSVQEAQQENAERTTKVIQALTQLGIPQENIQTAAFTIQPLYDFQDGTQIFKGYEVTHTLSITHTQIENAGQIIDVAVQEGVNRISNIEFTVDSYQKYEDEVLQLAVFDAQQKAKAIADSLNVTVDLVPLKVIEQSGYESISQQTFVKMDSGTTTPIEPGQIIFQATLEVEFQY